MKIERGLAALITGGSSGIGKGVALLLGGKGVDLTLVDYAAAEGAKAAEDVRRIHGGGNVHFVRCDVTNPGELANAFEWHMAEYGRLDICFNSAGVGETQWFLEDDSCDGSGRWRRVLDINLTALIDCTRLAARAMLGGVRSGRQRAGCIINVASAAGLYPSPHGPVYSASKGGVVLFTRSLAHLAKKGIRVNALCPEYVETPLMAQMTEQAARHFSKVLSSIGGYIPMRTVLEGVVELIEGESVAGECMWITVRHGRQWWPTEEEKARSRVEPKGKERKGNAKQQSYGVEGRMSTPRGPAPPSLGLAPARSAASPSPPGPMVFDGQPYSKISIMKLSSKFREASAIVQAHITLPLPPHSALLKVHYAGINASDINFSSGRYFTPGEASKRLPFDAGFEAVGVIVALGEGVTEPFLQPGRPAAVLTFGSFSEYIQLESRRLIPIASPTPHSVALLTSGLTASIALEQAARMRSGETVLVTAAAGGTGQFAVQLAKLAGNTVIAVCGSDEKCRMLKSIGADKVINYKTQDLAQELKAQCPEGVDIVYESVGGAMFETCLNALARFGRLVIIGMMSQYTAGEGGSWASQGYPGICEKLLGKSQSIGGFFLLHYYKLMREHFQRIHQLMHNGKLKVTVDPHHFVGLSAVADAVDHLYSGKSGGKVVVQIAKDVHPPPNLHFEILSVLLQLVFLQEQMQGPHPSQLQSPPSVQAPKLGEHGLKGDSPAGLEDQFQAAATDLTSRISLWSTTMGLCCAPLRPPSKMPSTTALRRQTEWPSPPPPSPTGADAPDTGKLGAVTKH